jgi:outer membrane receptor for ferrienterochelin and colicins
MNKRILCLLITLCIITATHAQDFLRLQIINNDSVPVKKATVRIFCNGKSSAAIADTNGYVNIPKSRTGCQITITAIGHETEYNIAITDTTNIIILEKQNSLLNEVVVTGQTKTTLVNNSVQKITSINASQIRQLGANNLADVMSMQSNFMIQQDNILGASLSMQGIGGQNIKVLVNGIPMNGRENGNIDLSQINVANIERIEIVKGPMSVLYGTDALGGVINIITKSATLSKRLDLQTQYESVGRLNNNIVLGTAFKRHSFNINAGRNFFDGELYIDTFNRAQAWKPKEQYNLDGNYTFQTSKGKIQYTPIWMKEHVYNRGTPKIDPFSAGAIDEHYFNKRMQHVLSGNYEIDKKRRFNISNSVSFYNRQRQRMFKDMITLKETMTTNDGDQDTSRFVDYNFRGLFTNEYNDVIAFIVGYDINSCSAQSGKIKNQLQSMNDYAVFVNTPIKITNKIVLQPAVRIAYNDKYNSPALPSLNAFVNVNKRLTLRAAYARGFRAPSLKEMYLDFVDLNHNVTGNENLSAESGHHVQANLDVIIRQQPKQKWTVFTNTYYNTIQNQIGLAIISTTRNEYQYKNVAQFKNIAQEIGSKYVSNKLQGQISATLNHIVGMDTLVGFTNVEILSTAQFKISKTLQLNTNYRFISKQAILGLSSISDRAYYNTYIPSMHLWDANLTQSVYKNKVQLQIGIKNIFNLQTLQTQGAPISSIHSSNGSQNVLPGRSVMMSIRYSY